MIALLHSLLMGHISTIKAKSYRAHGIGSIDM
jgi:hypothetical protein